jgi:hypothetical protein
MSFDINAPFDVILVTPTSAFNKSPVPPWFSKDSPVPLLNDSTKIPVVPVFIDFATIPELAFASTKIPDEPGLITSIPLESAVPPVLVVLEFIKLIPQPLLLSFFLLHFDLITLH